MKKAFTLLEIIFVLVIVALILSVALKNSIPFLQTSKSVKIKTDVALIRSAIAAGKHQRLLKSQNAYPKVLDEAKINEVGQLLFAGSKKIPLLEAPMKATSSFEKRQGAWSKRSNKQYEVWLDEKSSVVFTYDSTHGTFTCDYTNALCKELN